MRNLPRAVLPMLAVLLAILLQTACTPQQMLAVHRGFNPDGPYRAEVCASPAETGSRWACSPAKVTQLRREAARATAAVQRLATQRSCVPGNPSACEALVRSIASRYGVSPDEASNVARCESGFSPIAENGQYKGIYQQGETWWSSRSSAYGFAGRSIFDPVANISVSMGMVRDGGWGPWECQP